MFYIFIVFLAIATIALYRLQKNLEKGPPHEGRHEEQTASPDREEEYQTDNQDEPSIPQTTQTLSLPEQQTEISIAGHPGTIADVTETVQNEVSTDRDLTAEDSPVTEQQETIPTSQKVTLRGVLAFIAGMTYLVTTFTLMEMEHPLAIVFLGILLLAGILWFVLMPPKQRAEMKAMWAVVKVRAKAAEEQKARSPFRKAVKVIGVSIVIVIILVILIEFLGKYL